MNWSFRIIASCAGILSCSPAVAQSPLKVERVVMLMRHGIRPPTTLQPIPLRYSELAWPRWPVGPGLLTPHGAQGIKLLAAADRAYFARLGVLSGAGCPAAGQVQIRASHVTRAIETAQAWSTGLAPGCKLAVEHPASGAPDPLFHILDPRPAWFNGDRAYRAALAQAPAGGLPAQVRQVAPELRQISSVLGCTPPGCNMLAGSTITPHRHGRPDMSGPLDAASTASETFLLEYLEGMPMKQVAWGRIDRRQILRLLVFNSIKFKYVDRPRFIARAAAGPLAKAILRALEAPAASRATLFAGHDTNIADLGGLLDAHWRVTGYPADAVPPGSALGFELLADDRGRRFVRAFFRAQTMEQLRNLEGLGSANQPYRQYVPVPGCSDPRIAFGCELGTFRRLVEARLR
ncbi:MAG: histidine-type phosphatase [Pseudomonadota bacterium]